MSLLITSVIGILPVFLYTSFVNEKENPELMDRISKINENPEEANIFDVNENAEEKQDSTSSVESKDENTIKKEDDQKSEDGWEKLLDDEEKKNRFDDKDDTIDRFKPKY